jgi:hypothetical protein
MAPRMRGLHAAIFGVCGDSDTPFDVGLHQLASDVADQMEECAGAFEVARWWPLTPDGKGGKTAA